MNDQSAYLVQAIRGPVMLITIGVLFAFDRFTDFRFSQTWPAILIVAGLLRLAGGSRRRSYGFPPRVAPHPPAANVPPPPPPPGPGATEYSPRYAESIYRQPPAPGPRRTTEALR